MLNSIYIKLFKQKSSSIIWFYELIGSSVELLWLLSVINCWKSIIRKYSSYVEWSLSLPLRLSEIQKTLGVNYQRDKQKQNTNRRNVVCTWNVNCMMKIHQWVRLNPLTWSRKTKKPGLLTVELRFSHCRKKKQPRPLFQVCKWESKVNLNKIYLPTTKSPRIEPFLSRFKLFWNELMRISVQKYRLELKILRPKFKKFL